MSPVVSALFGGGSNAAANQQAEEAQQQQQLAAIGQARQQQTAQDQSAQTAGQYAGIKVVRGERLLQSSADGGLADTLGKAT